MQFSEAITKNTLVDYPRLRRLVQELGNVRDVPGSVAEVGVYKGGTAVLLATHTAKPLYLFDTFQGMPPVGPQDLHKEGDFSDTSIDHVRELVREARLNQEYQPWIKKGVFPRQTGYIIAPAEQFSLVHLDVDIYTSVRDCLEFFHTRMSTGGVIILDDYLEPNCPGAKLATDEFAERHGKVVVPTCQSQALIRY